MRHLPDRSGLIRMPVESRIGFVHRTFDGVGDVDLSPLAGMPNLTVYVRKDRVTGAELLGEGSSVVAR